MKEEQRAAYFVMQKSKRTLKSWKLMQSKFIFCTYAHLKSTMILKEQSMSIFRIMNQIQMHLITMPLKNHFINSTVPSSVK